MQKLECETAIRETKEEVGLDVEIIDEEPIKTGHLVHGGTMYKDILLFIARPINDEIRLQTDEVKRLISLRLMRLVNFLLNIIVMRGE